VPSDVPPVRSPKERAKSNGEPEDEGAPVVIAPGTNGDVHGGSVPPSPGQTPGPHPPSTGA